MTSLYMPDYRLILETSGRVGQVGLARGDVLVREAMLDATRRHARDLSTTVSRLLAEENVTPPELAGIIVGIGPGGYTGLRVGVMSAKALAYAAGCPLVAVPTFHAIAHQSPACERLWVLADALQGAIYLQRFDNGSPIDELQIVPASEWLPWASGVALSGPGVAIYAALISCAAKVVPDAEREPQLASLLAVGLRLSPVTREELLRLEPIYLRGSSAEEKAKATLPQV